MNHKIINRFIGMLSSIKFALILLVLIVFTTGLSTFVIQGQSNDFYIKNFPLFGSLILKIGFDNFFRSLIFIVLMGLFFINLSLCTVKRIFKEVTGQINIKFGPDIIHIGLLTLLIGGSINIIGEQKAMVMLSVGENIVVGENSVILDDFEFLKYENGSPKDWISTLSVKNNSGETIYNNKTIEVNKPLRFSGYSIFQSNYRVINSANVESEGLNSYIIKSGYMFTHNGFEYILEDVEPGISASFRVSSGEKTEYLKYNIGSSIGEYILTDSSENFSSGLLIKKEPGYFVNYIALILILIGFSITYIQKIGAKER